MKRGDIYFVSLEPTVGHEQRGERPVLVISPDAFNLRTHAPVIVPITNGGAFARSSGLAVSLHGFGLRTTGIVRCDRPRTVDLDTRGARFIEAVPTAILVAVLGRVGSLFLSL